MGRVCFRLLPDNEEHTQYRHMPVCNFHLSVPSFIHILTNWPTALHFRLDCVCRNVCSTSRIEFFTTSCRSIDVGVASVRMMSVFVDMHYWVQSPAAVMSFDGHPIRSLFWIPFLVSINNLLKTLKVNKWSRRIHFRLLVFFFLLETRQTTMYVWMYPER